MGQFFPSLEKIGALSESANTVTLADSHLKIGGQGYDTGELQLALSTMTANTRFQLYVVLSAGVPTLVKSTNENSVGPAGYDSWALVGSLYSNAADTFGRFVTIEGSPTSGYEPIILTSTFVTNVTLTPYMKCMGDKAKFLVRLAFAGVTDNDNLHLFLPSGMTIDSKVGLRASVGSGMMFDNSNSFSYPLNPSVGGSADIAVFDYYDHAAGANPLRNRLVSKTTPHGADFGSGDTIDLEFSIPIAEWSNTQIKDR